MLWHTGMLICSCEGKWSSVVCCHRWYTMSSSVKRSAPFTGSTSLKFRAHLRRVHTWVLIGRTVVGGYGQALFIGVRVSVSLDWHLLKTIINSFIIDVAVIWGGDYQGMRSVWWMQMRGQQMTSGEFDTLSVKCVSLILGQSLCFSWCFNMHPMKIDGCMFLFQHASFYKV